MIRKFITRFFGKQQAGSRSAPVTLGVGKHGIRRASISSGSRRVVEALQQQGYQAYIVGGAVRDLFVGMTPKDFDVATNATPEQVRQCFRRARIIGRRFRIVHVMMGSETVEVTTFRGPHLASSGSKTSLSLADETGRLVRDNVFGSQKDDAARRDFTVNALYYDPVTETVLDYHQGIEDLKQKKLCMIGDPQTRYREDPVRMLRAVRLAAKLGFTIEEETYAPIRELSDLISNVPPSRLFDEMLKLLTSGQAVNCVVQLRLAGLHQKLLPLLDVVLAQPEGERFVMCALQKTDERVRDKKPVSPGFLFATLLWHEVLSKWEHSQAQGERPIPALFAAMDDVLDMQAEKLAITHRIASDIKDIWALQPRFIQRSGKRPFSLLEQLRFKAGYDFLLLRVEAGEVPAEIGAWWTAFFNADPDARATMLIQAKPGENKKRRRRTVRKKTVAEQAA